MRMHHCFTNYVAEYPWVATTVTDHEENSEEKFSMNSKLFFIFLKKLKDEKI